MPKKPTYEELEKRVQELEQAESEHKHNEAELIHSHKLMDYIISHARSAIAIHDRDLNYIYVSKRYIKEYKIKEQNVIGKHHYEIFPDLPQKWRDVHQRSLAGEVLSEEEDPYYREDGSVDWTRWECRPWYESDGSIGGIIIYTEVINERKKVEEALQKNEARFRQVYEHIAVGIARVSINFQIENANDAYCRMVGYREDELIGQYLGGIIPQEVVEANLQKQTEVAAGKIECYRMEKQFIHKEGHIIYGILDAKLVRSDEGTPRFFLVSVVDITSRKLSEKALQESEKKHKNISFLSSDYFYALNVGNSGQLCIDWISESFERVTSYSQKEIENFNNWVSHIYPEDLPNLDKNTELLLSNHPVTNQYRIIVKNGDIRWFTDRLHPEWSEEENRVVKVYGAVRDITERKNAEKEKEKLQLQLSQTQKFEAIGTLASGIAHQFNNALSALMGNIDLLEMDFPSNKNIAHYTKGMRASVHRMTQLTAKLLAYARGGKYQAKTVLLCDFIREIIPLVNHTIDSTIHLNTDLPRDFLNVKVDLTQIQLVLSAILTNASEAIESKGGRISVTCQKVSITDDIIKGFPGLKLGNYACLTITDNGKGMDEESRARVFEPFFTTKFEGRGLGMAAVYGIVKNHNGWITVDSNLHEGTIVKIYLPAVKTPVMVEARPEQKKEWFEGAATILVIDDEVNIIEIARAMLERLGYNVLEAKTGQEAINVVKTFDGAIDLALLDILLPDMKGNVLYPFLVEARPDLKVIVSSGYSSDGPAREILNAGAKGFLQKPYTMADLSTKLKKTIECE
jgi:PAS domain S-box-containing protein